MNPPPSRLLRFLDERIARARTRHEADCARGERACYMARQGNFADASREIQHLMVRYQEQPDAEIFIWINLAEGLVNYFRELGHLAREKIMRAYALSSASGISNLHALSAAWLAQMDFAKLAASGVATYAMEAFKFGSTDNHAARFRASIVVAQALHLSGRWDLAAPWYTVARLHATAEGDTLSISALMHNMVSMRLDHFRQVILTGGGESSGAAYALVGIDSSENFDSLIGSSTLEELRPIMRARFLSLSSRPSEALSIYEDQVIGKILTRIVRLESDVMSDIGLCYLKQGNVVEAKRAIGVAEDAISRCAQVDDLAATHTRLRDIYSSFGDAATASSHDLRATDLWMEFRGIQHRFVESLGSVKPPAPPS